MTKKHLFFDVGGKRMKKLKKLTALVVAFAMTLVCIMTCNVGNVNVKAAEAEELVLGKTYSESLGTGTKDSGYRYKWYKVTIPSSGKFTVTVTHYGEDNAYFKSWTILNVYDSTGNTRLLEDKNTFDVGANKRTLTCSNYFNQGTYLIYFETAGNSKSLNLEYEISTSFNSSNVSFEETYTSKHNAYDSANYMNLGVEYVGQMSIGDKTDYYKFTVDKSSYVKLFLTSDTTYTCAEIIKDDVEYSLLHEFDTASVNGADYYMINELFYLNAGTYYLRVYEYYNNYYVYNFEMSYANIGWVENSDGTMSYYDSDGDLVKDEWVAGKDGELRYLNPSGIMVTNQFVCDGTYTYFLQADGSPMKDRLTYHPDGIHVIYFDEDGHEVFSDFAHVKRSIAGEAVDDYCFFDVNGYLYVDVVTYDKAGEELYYANPYGVLERGKWFQFSNTVMCADGTPWAGAAGGYGYARSDGTLVTNTWTTDWMGRRCYLQGNGVALY